MFSHRSVMAQRPYSEADLQKDDATAMSGSLDFEATPTSRHAAANEPASVLQFQNSGPRTGDLLTGERYPGLLNPQVRNDAFPVHLTC